MPRFRSSRTGTVIVTDEDTATRMGSEWQVVEEPKKPTKKTESK